MLFTPFAVVALLASFVNGQALPDACIQNCTQTAASVTGCVSFTNVSCVCSSTAFQQAALSCLVSDCTQADVQTAETLQQTICGGTSSNSSSSAASHSTASSSSSESSTSTTSTTESTTSSSASSTPSSTSPATSSTGSTSSSASSTSSSAAAATSSSAALGAFVAFGGMDTKVIALGVGFLGAVVGGVFTL